VPLLSIVASSLQRKLVTILYGFSGKFCKSYVFVKNFCYSKKVCASDSTINRVRRQLTEYREIFSNNISDE
jgi:hypothetical protein